MKKVFDQTVRDIKREVNKKVLKVPGIEQKVLDATSNEPWGPHGSLLADIAQASRNYHEYQMIMGVIWKRLSDTGKNWRHVYKALTVLEYMVGHGSERVIDEIRERAYQISTLADFQYIDSSGRDQGSNVRKKSQSLVALVNDKERIAEVREKAAANKDKYRGSATDGMYRPSGGYGDKYDYESRYGGRDEERSSYGREREYGYRDDDRYSRDGDRYSRDSESQYGKDGYRDDDYRGRSRSVDYQYGSRSRSSDRDRAGEDDGQSSSRGSGARADDHSQDGIGRRLERKFSEQNIGAPPSYEEAVSESRSPVHSERDGGEAPQVAVPGAASGAAPGAASPYDGNNADKAATGFGDESSPQTREVEAFDEFDPRGPVSAAPPASVPVDAAPAPASDLPASNTVEMDLLGSLSDVFAPNPLAIVPVDSASVETNGHTNSGPAPSFATSQPSTQPFDDPFGDSPFKAIPSANTDPSSQQSFAAPSQPTQPTHTTEISQLAAPRPDSSDNFGFGDSFSAVPNHNPGVPNMQPLPNSQAFSQEPLTSESELDILAGILPPSGPSASLPSQPGAPIPTSEFVPNNGNVYQNFHPQPVTTASSMPAKIPFGQTAQPYNVVSQSQNLTGGMPYNLGGFMHQQGTAGPASIEIPQYAPQPTSGTYLPQPVSAPPSSFQNPYRTLSAPAGQLGGGNFMMQQGPGPGTTSSGPVAQHGNNGFGDIFTSTGPSSLGTSSSQPTFTPSTGPLDIVPQPQPQKKFEPKSGIWADTLSRGLVNLNISGPKTNPLADIGVDFDAINRKEKRMEKQPTTQVISTITMGKAMGSGSGMGRAGASGMRPPPTPMVGTNMAMGGMSQQPMGMGMGMGMNMGGYGQGYPMQPQPGMGPGPGMPGVYNPMMGPGNYNPQQPYGGYR